MSTVFLETSLLGGCSRTDVHSRWAGLIAEGCISVWGCESQRKFQKIWLLGHTTFEIHTCCQQWLLEEWDWESLQTGECCKLTSRAKSAGLAGDLWTEHLCSFYFLRSSQRFREHYRNTRNCKKRKTAYFSLFLFTETWEQPRRLLEKRAHLVNALQKLMTLLMHC